MLKVEQVTQNKIVISAPGCEDYWYATAKEVHDSIQELQRGLFAWHELTGESIDKPACS